MAKLWFDQQRAQDQSFGLIGMDTFETMPAGMVERPEGTPYWLFVLFYDEVEVNLNGHNHTVPNNSLVIWKPDRPHHLGNKQQRWRHSWFFANGSAISDSLQHTDLSCESVIPIKQLRHSEQFFADLYHECSSYPEYNHRIITQSLDIWLQRIQRDLSPIAVQDSRFLELQRFIENNCEQQHTLKSLAEHANMSASHLSSEFKKHAKCSPIDFLLRCRLERARYLLSDHNNRIKEIAERVGFQDAFHFSKMFKKRYGLSPRAMRQQGSPL